jgi:hypothetical protein
MMKIQMGNLSKEAVLKIVQMRGPVIPNDIRKELGGENLIIGAILSELACEGKIKVTATKIGSTPAYYCTGGESRLLNLVKYLNEKDRKTVDFLKQRKILKDSDMTPLLRVSLRNIKDFAKPLEVTVKGQKEIYWKWYLTPTQEAEQLILKKVKSIAKPVIKAPEPILVVQPIMQEPEVEAPKPMPAPEVKKEIKEAKPAEPVKEKVKEALKEKKEETRKEDVKKERKKEEAKPEVQKELGKTAEELEHEKDPFFKKIWEYFKSNDVQIVDYKIIRKKSEIELHITVPSRIGSQDYYCKAKGKNKVNDGDLSSAYIQGQAKKLPVLFITTGELTKKAKEMLSRDFKGMTVKKI